MTMREHNTQTHTHTQNDTVIETTTVSQLLKEPNFGPLNITSVRLNSVSHTLNIVEIAVNGAATHHQPLDCEESRHSQISVSNSLDQSQKPNAKDKRQTPNANVSHFGQTREFAGAPMWARSA